jgi:hypothetical protein
VRFGSMKGWQFAIGDGSPNLLCALWMRDVEHIQVPGDPTVPGPLDCDTLPGPSTGDQPGLGAEWLAWWWSIIDMSERPPILPPDLVTEPAYDTPDPLGLARLPLMRKVVARRYAEHLSWNINRDRDTDRRQRMNGTRTTEVVRSIEADLGRKVRPFEVRVTLLPVRDDRIRQVTETTYLVPEQVYDGPDWPIWLRSLLLRIA